MVAPTFVLHPLLPRRAARSQSLRKLRPICSARGTPTRRALLRTLAAAAATTVLPPPQRVPPALSDTAASQGAATAPALTFRALPSPPTCPVCRPVEVADLRAGTGRAVVPGSVVTLRWTGRLADRYGWPIQKEDADEVALVVGRGKLIEGFEMGVDGMREGGKRRIVIPAELGYRDERKGPLPQRFGDRRRLFATVLNERRFKKAGDLLIDVQVRKVRPPHS